MQKDTLHKLGKRHGWNNQTLINRLEKANVDKWPEFYDAVAKDLRITLEQLFAPDLYVEESRPPLAAVREPLVLHMIEILEDPEQPESKKSLARETILDLTRAAVN